MIPAMCLSQDQPTLKCIYQEMLVFRFDNACTNRGEENTAD